MLLGFLTLSATRGVPFLYLFFLKPDIVFFLCTLPIHFKESHARMLLTESEVLRDERKITHYC